MLSLSMDDGIPEQGVWPRRSKSVDTVDLQDSRWMSCLVVI